MKRDREMQHQTGLTETWPRMKVSKRARRIVSEYDRNVDFYALGDEKKIEKFEKVFRGKLSNYAVQVAVGEGTFGQVYFAETNTRPTQKVVVKMMKSVDIEAFVALHLNRRTIEGAPFVRMFDAGYDRELRQAFLVYERMDGDMEDFIEMARGTPRMEETVLFTFLHEILDGVSTLHALGLAHNDIKPENLLFRVGRHGQTEFKIGDYGLVAGESRLPGGVLALSRASAGTPKFFAPEVVNRGYKRTTAEDMQRADMWSLGMTIFFVVTMGRSGLPYNLSDNAYRRKLRQGGMMVEADYDCGLRVFLQRYGTVIARLPATHRLAYALVERMLVFDPERRMTARAAKRMIDAYPIRVHEKN